MAAKNGGNVEVKQPASAKGKAMQVPKLVRQDKAMPIKGKGK